jgi:sugar-specific transcriptional regulator TrmB
MEKTLTKIGLSKKEAQAYLATLELGTATALQIANKAEINRSTAYASLENLINLGLVTSFEKAKKTFFAAENPENLKNLIEKKETALRATLEDLNQSLPRFKAIFNRAENKPIVRFFEGKAGLKAIQQDFLREGAKTQDACEFYHAGDVYQVFSEEERKIHHQKRLEAGINMRILYNKTDGRLESRGPYTKRLWIPEDKFKITADITCYHDRVSIASLRDNLVGVIIESEAIAQAFRNIFNLAWEAAEKYNPSAQSTLLPEE